MAVYVDEPVFAKHGLRWCHLTADSAEELHAFAARLGLRRSRFQTKPGRPWADHYDITEEKRGEAVALGAVEVTLREMGAQLARKRDGFREGADAGSDLTPRDAPPPGRGRTQPGGGPRR